MSNFLNVNGFLPKFLLGFLFGFVSCLILSMSQIPLQGLNKISYSVVNDVNFTHHQLADYVKVSERGPKDSKQISRSSIENIRHVYYETSPTYNTSRILCMILTAPKYIQTRAIHVKATWGKRCDILLFMSTQKDDALSEIVVLDTKEDYKQLWAKTKASFRYVYDHYIEKADWFVKADDDTYMIVDNLRHLLKDYNTSSPIYFGCKFKPFVRQGYMSGGAGYVLSREAVIRFVEDGLKKQHPGCHQSENTGAEDVQVGRCMEALGVKGGDSRDSRGGARFFPFTPEQFLVPSLLAKIGWFFKYAYYPIIDGMNCCNDAISFHYVSPETMHLFEYLIYKVNIYVQSSNHTHEISSEEGG